MIHVRVTCFLRYGPGVLVVFGCLFRSGYKYGVKGTVINISINIKTNFYSYLHLLTFRRLRQFAYFSFLRVLIDSVSCIVQCNLRRFSSSAWVPLGRDFRAYRCCQDQSARIFILVDYLLAVTSGRIAVVRTKVLVSSSLSINRSNRLAHFGYRFGY